MVVGRALVKGGRLPARKLDASLLPQFERKGHAHDGARFARMALVRLKLRCAEHDLAAIVLFAASPAQGFPCPVRYAFVPPLRKKISSAFV